MLCHFFLGWGRATVRVCAGLGVVVPSREVRVPGFILFLGRFPVPPFLKKILFPSSLRLRLFGLMRAAVGNDE